MASPCSNSPDEVVSRIYEAEAAAKKLDKFVNGEATETVQIGADATPTVRNIARQIATFKQVIEDSATDITGSDLSSRSASVAGGTTARTFASRFADTLNAKDFGAVADSSTDNTAAINAAIAASSGQAVLIPEGCYYDRPSLVNSSNVQIIDDSTGIRVTNRDYWWRPEPSSVRWLAHRGWMSGCPENTVLSFSYAAKMKAYAIETDVRFTSDGEMVLMHDDTVDRTTNGTGYVSSLSFSEIRALRADYLNGSPLCSGRYAELKVPTLEEYLDICKYDAIHPMIELKAGTNEQLVEINDVVCSYGMEDFVIYLCDYVSQAELMRSINKRAEIVTGVSTFNDPSIVRDYSRLGGKLCLGGHLPNITANFVEMCRSYGVDVYAYSVDSYEAYATMMDLGVNFYLGNSLYEGDK